MKRATWDWTPMHEEALKLLIRSQCISNFGANISHRHIPNWMGICNPLSIHTYVAARTWMSQPSHWVLFFSFKDAKKPYSVWEKSLFVICLALQEAKNPIRTAIDHFVRAFWVFQASTVWNSFPRRANSEWDSLQMVRINWSLLSLSRSNWGSPKNIPNTRTIC